METVTLTDIIFVALKWFFLAMNPHVRFQTDLCFCLMSTDLTFEWSLATMAQFVPLHMTLSLCSIIAFIALIWFFITKRPRVLSTMF